MKFLTRTVILLSLVSLCTDLASEMLYPVMPMYLRSIGFSVVLIGALEGFAEATAGLSKGYFGNLSDALGRRRPFVQLGYTLSAVSKPMMAAMSIPLWIFAARTMDRLGKGIRTGARDAMLSAETSPEFKGRVFGFHRGFDTLGAVLGPAVALLFLMAFPGEYRLLFILAVIPGLFAIALTLILAERPSEGRHRSRPGLFSFFLYWKRSERPYRLLVAGLLVFALFNSSDILLLLLLREQGATDTHVILIYIAYNLVYALASFPLGALGDRIGLKKTFIAGLILFAVVYAAMTQAHSVGLMLVLFGLYGLYAASTEGISKAWITNIVPASEVATAIGLYTGFQSIATLLASSLAGWLWWKFGAQVPFLLAAGATLLTATYFLFFVPGIGQCHCQTSEN